MIEQTRGGNCAHYVTVLALQHPQQQVSCHIDVGHHVDLPDPVPIARCSLWSSSDSNAGVGTEDVDATVIRYDALDEASDIVLIGHIASDAGSADLLSNGGDSISIDVSHHNVGGSR